MYTLFFWIAIALLGLFVYVYPSFAVHRMYEAYEDVNVTINPPAMGPPILKPVQNAQKPVDPVQELLKTQDNDVSHHKPEPVKNSPNVPAGPAGTPDFKALAQSIQSLLEPGTSTPNMSDDLPSPNAPAPTIQTEGATPQPDGATTIRSTPQTAADAMKPVQSQALLQGTSFQMTKPPPVVIVNEYPVVSQPNDMLLSNPIVPEGCPPIPNMKEYIRRDMVPKPHKCPPPPQCPDMSKYIRKDSIPCWGCKLK
jgi:hypothetical protein